MKGANIMYTEMPEQFQYDISKRYTINFTFFEPCVVIYICSKNQQNAHFLC